MSRYIDWEEKWVLDADGLDAHDVISTQLVSRDGETWAEGSTLLLCNDGAPGSIVEVDTETGAFIEAIRTLPYGELRDWRFHEQSRSADPGAAFVMLHHRDNSFAAADQELWSTHMNTGAWTQAVEGASARVGFRSFALFGTTDGYYVSYASGTYDWKVKRWTTGATIYDTLADPTSYIADAVMEQGQRIVLVVAHVTGFGTEYELVTIDLPSLTVTTAALPGTAEGWFYGSNFFIVEGHYFDGMEGTEADGSALLLRPGLDGRFHGYTIDMSDPANGGFLRTAPFDFGKVYLSLLADWAWDYACAMASTLDATNPMWGTTLSGLGQGFRVGAIGFS